MGSIPLPTLDGGFYSSEDPLSSMLRLDMSLLEGWSGEGGFLGVVPPPPGGVNTRENTRDF
jgi:hypothetical protein